jgi:hypothetical protein
MVDASDGDGDGDDARVSRCIHIDRLEGVSRS